MCHGICVKVIGQPPVSVHIFHIDTLSFIAVHHCMNEACWPISTSYLTGGKLSFADVYNHLSFSLGSGVLEWGPHACAAITLPGRKFSKYTYLISWSSIFFIIINYLIHPFLNYVGILSILLVLVKSLYINFSCFVGI